MCEGNGKSILKCIEDAEWFKQYTKHNQSEHYGAKLVNPGNVT